MTRRAFAMLSLLGLFLSLGLWATAYFNIEYTCFEYFFYLKRGGLRWAENQSTQEMMQAGMTQKELENYRQLWPPEWKTIGFETMDTDWWPRIDTDANDLTGYGRLNGWVVYIPVWPFSLALLILPVYSFIKGDRRRQPYFRTSTYNIAEARFSRFATKACVVGAVICGLIWFVQFWGPFQFARGPAFRSFKMDLHPYFGWTMLFDKTPHADSRTSLIIQELNEEVGQWLPPPGSYSLVGLGHGALQIRIAEVSPYKAYGKELTETTLTLGRNIRLPALTFAVILLVLAAMFCTVPFYLRRVRRKMALCLNCGYDLRGSRDRCPECGTPFRAAEPPAPELS